jgi:hypothetical protein
MTFSLRCRPSSAPPTGLGPRPHRPSQTASSGVTCRLFVTNTACGFELALIWQWPRQWYDFKTATCAFVCYMVPYASRLMTVSARVVWCIVIVAFCISYESLYCFKIDKFNNRALFLFTLAAIPIPVLSLSSYIKPQQLATNDTALAEDRRTLQQKSSIIAHCLVQVLIVCLQGLQSEGIEG